ncbi:MAG: hypothetical protein ABI273_01180 [Lacunisphaera sp.]
MNATSPEPDLDKPFSRSEASSKRFSAFFVHLRFLRPLRSLLVISGYTLAAKMWAEQEMHQISSLIALAIALPLSSGFFIAGAAHEPMHRPFALLLPALRKRQRKFAIIAVLVASVATTLATIWATAALVPPMAIAGLAFALTALPCLKQNGPDGKFGLIGIFALLACFRFGPDIGTKLPLLMNSAPWLFLLGGLIVGVVSVVRGFCRESARARASTAYLSQQTVLFSYAFRSGMTAEKEAAALIANEKPHRRIRQNSLWTVRSVGPAPLDWMRALWYANFGSRMHGSFLRIQLRSAGRIALYTCALPVIICLFDGNQGYWWNLAQLASPDRTNHEMLPLLLQPGLAIIFIFGLVTPTILYPISRQRMARVIFRQSTILSGLALVIPFAVIFFASLIGQIVSGIFLPGCGLPSLLAVDLLLAIFLPLTFLLGTIQTPLLRIIAAVPVILTLFFMTLFRSHWINFALSLPGCALMLTLAGIPQWLFWQRLQHDYATADLTRQTSSITPQLSNLYP